VLWFGAVEAVQS